MNDRMLIATTVPATIRSFLLPFAAHFRSTGWRVDAMARGLTDSEGCAAHFDRVWDVPWSRNPLDPSNLLRASARVRALVVAEGYRIVHVHTPVAGFVVRYALRGLRGDLRPKVVYTAHGFHFYRGGPALRNALFLGLERLAGRWTDRLVVINREDEAAAVRHRLLPADRVRYMPGIGVDTAALRPSPALDEAAGRARDELGVPPSAPMFLQVAEFIPRKRHGDAVRAFAGLGPSDARLVFAGQGPTMAATRALAGSLGVGARVHFLGQRGDVPALVRASTAVLLPSAQEGLPRSAMEALALERPVIGSDIRGIRDLLEGGAGILVRVGDVDGLGRAMRQLIDEPDRAGAMGRLGRDRVAALDTARIIREHEDLYAEVSKG